MPTVNYSCPDTGKPKKKEFPYTAVGKAQADTFAKLMGGKKKIILTDIQAGTNG